MKLKHVYNYHLASITFNRDDNKQTDRHRRGKDEVQRLPY